MISFGIVLLIPAINSYYFSNINNEVNCNDFKQKDFSEFIRMKSIKM